MSCTKLKNIQNQDNNSLICIVKCNHQTDLFEAYINKKVLLTGVRSLFTLDLARRFHEKGYRVFTAETSLHHICRFSNAIEKNFVIPSPRFHSDRFITALVEICDREKIDIVVPTFEEIFCLAKGLHRFPKSCTILCENYETLDHLHNKWLFNKKIEHMGLSSPKSYLVHSQKELDELPLKAPYILKPSYSRSSMQVQKVTSATTPKIKFTSHNPFVAQEFIHGKKFCSYSISHSGKLSAHVVYPVDISIEGNSCLNFKVISHAGIEEWIKHFVEKENFTGQIAFDFIENSQGKLYAIECNPRGTSGLHLFQKKDDLPNAFLNFSDKCIYPTIGYSKQIIWGMLLYGWKTTRPSIFIRKFLKTKDIIFSLQDIKPFLYQPLLFGVYIFKSLKLRARLPAMFTFDIDWNGQEATTFEQSSCEDLS